MVAVQNIDVRGMESMINGIRYALIGTGGDASTVVADECVRLAEEVTRKLGPQSKTKGEKKIELDLKKFLVTPFENLAWDQRGHGDLRWISAGPTFLSGIAPEDYRLNDSSEDIYRDYQKNRYNRRGNAYVRLGYHFQQHTYRINRVAVTKSARSSILQRLLSHVGRFKASIAETIVKIKQTDAGVPAYVKRHFPSPANITDLSQMNSPEFSSVTFGSRAKGITGARKIFQDAVKTREYKMAQRLKLILSGYSHDVAHGIRPGRRGKDGNGHA